MGAPTLLCPSAPLPHPHPRDCAEEQLNGPGPSREVLIFLGGDRQRPLHVFCDMESNGGGWLVGKRGGGEGVWWALGGAMRSLVGNGGHRVGWLTPWLPL